MGGTPPPLYGQNFRQIGGYGFGGYPPFTDKIRKVVFEVPPKCVALIGANCVVLWKLVLVSLSFSFSFRELHELHELH